MKKSFSFGKKVAKRSALLAMALVLGGCFDDGGGSSDSELPLVSSITSG